MRGSVYWLLVITWRKRTAVMITVAVVTIGVAVAVTVWVTVCVTVCVINSMLWGAEGNSV
jgi:hypothetical protein